MVTTGGGISTRLPPSGEKPATVSWRLLPKQIWKDSLPIDMHLSAVSVLIIALPGSEIAEGLMNCPVLK